MNRNIYRIIVSACIIFGVIAPVAIGYIYGWNILRNFAIQFAISVYAVSTVVHFVSQLIFAELNRRQVESIARQHDLRESSDSSSDNQFPAKSVIDIDNNTIDHTNNTIDKTDNTTNNTTDHNHENINQTLQDVEQKYSISLAAKNELSTIEEQKTYTANSYAIQVVGMNEDPEYFQQCLLHIKRILHHDHHCVKVIICIDQIDHKMANIAKEIFDLDDIVLDTPLQLMPIQDRYHILSKISKKVICIQQPHLGKRYAMYTASWLIINLGIKYILMTDSDTLLDVSVGKYLKQLMFDNVAAVTGVVRIFNISNWLSLIIDLKYWCAFNIERSAQSYFGSVACVSGPIGLYKTEILSDVIDTWVTQTFLGRLTTFGDDRHLTNLIIKSNYQVKYTHLAVCYTETPVTLIRWWAQQARWGRSFIREYLIGLRWIYRSYWLAYDMTYLVFYSIFLFVFACIGLANLNINTLLLTCLTTIIASGCRALYGLLLTKNLTFVCFIIYGGVYFCWLLPLKIWSCLTIFIRRWGTSMRVVKSSNYFDTWPVLLWCGYVIYGIVHACLNAKIEIVSYTYISLICASLSVAYIIYTGKKAILYRTQQRVFLDSRLE